MTNKQQITEVVEACFDENPVHYTTDSKGNQKVRVMLTSEALTKLLEERDESVEFPAHKCEADLILISCPPKYRCSVCGLTDDSLF